MNLSSRQQQVFAIFAVATATLMIAGPSATSAADWARWRGPDENGISPEKLPSKPALDNIEWKAEVGIGFSSFAVADGKVYTMGHDGKKSGGNETVFCFEAATGKNLWSDSYPAPLIDRFYEGGPGASPAVLEGKVYTYSKHGRLHCYEAASGERLWERDMMKEAGLDRTPEWGFSCTPYFTGGKLIIECGNTFALDPATGKVLWKSPKYTPAYANPKQFELDGRSLLATLKTEGIVITDAADGKEVASAPWQTRFSTNATTPIVQGNEIFMSTGYDRGCALFELEGGTLTKRYENKLMSNHMSNCVLIDGHLYGFDGTAHMGKPTEFACIEWATGKERWRVGRGEGLGCGSLIADAAGNLIILSERGELVIATATPEEFKETAREQVLGGRCWTPPVLAGGRIYCRNAAGNVVCIGVD